MELRKILKHLAAAQQSGVLSRAQFESAAKDVELRSQKCASVRAVGTAQTRCFPWHAVWSDRVRPLLFAAAAAAAALLRSVAFILRSVTAALRRWWMVCSRLLSSKDPQRHNIDRHTIASEPKHSPNVLLHSPPPRPESSPRFCRSSLSSRAGADSSASAPARHLSFGEMPSLPQALLARRHPP